MLSPLQQNVPLASLTTYRLGGAARYYLKPESHRALQNALNWARGRVLPVFILGGGSNVLFSDHGFPGLVVHLRGFNATVTRHREGEWEVGAGIMLTPWIRQLVSCAQAGAEALIGIPGTLGGALLMNAGAFGMEISQTLIDVECLDQRGEVIIMSAEQIGFGYRQAPGLANKIALSARFRMQPGDPRELLVKARGIVALRRLRQPLQYPSCGSVFKRPQGDYAGRLIEACGLKGASCGAAQISEQHANFIVNRGNASASEVLNLIKLARQRVLNEQGVNLELEVKLVGFNPDELEGV